MKPIIAILPILIAAAGCSRNSSEAAAPATPAPAEPAVEASVTPTAPAESAAVPDPAAAVAAAPAPAAPVMHNYDSMQLTPIINRMVKGGRDFANGEKVFNDIGCRLCHLFNGGAGGIGPDLSGLGGRFGTLEILQSILEPDLYVSDLYGKMGVETADGKYYEGRFRAIDAQTFGLIENYSVNPESGAAYWGEPTVKIRYDDVVWQGEAIISPMPGGMINGLNEEQIADMVAYLESGGNPENESFKPLKE